MRLHIPLAIALLLTAFPRQTSARTVPLLEVTHGQVPTDTGSDGLTKMTQEDRPELGGKAVKVVFHAGDSFGDRQARVTN